MYLPIREPSRGSAASARSGEAKRARIYALTPIGVHLRLTA